LLLRLAVALLLSAAKRLARNGLWTAGSAVVGS